jgi:preprotein translocase subunit SecA
MFSFLLKRFSGRHYKKFLEKARPTVAQINEQEKSYQSLTDDQCAPRRLRFVERLAAATDKRAAL